MEASTSSAVAPVSASAVEAVRLTVVVPVDVMSVCSIYDAALTLLSMRVWVEEMAVPLLRRTASAVTAEPGGKGGGKGGGNGGRGQKLPKRPS